MKAEICQTNIIWENKTENLKKAESIIKRSEGDIILFPEMSFTGFSMNTAVTGENDCFTVNAVREMAVKYNKAVGFGWVYKAEDKAENHYTFVNNIGEMLSNYIKIHPFSYSGEDKYFKGGNKISVFEFMGFKISSLICYDLRFPEIFQAVSKKADIIIVPACWPKARAEHWKTLIKARAIENMCYIIGINCVGNVGGIEYSGDSCVVTPDGNVIEIISNKEGNVLLDIKNDVEKYRKAFPVKMDRKEELYKKL